MSDPRSNPRLLPLDEPPGVPLDRWFVEPAESGMWIEDLLLSRRPSSDRRAWRRALRAGLVTVRGEPTQPQTRVRCGDWIEIFVPPQDVAADRRGDDGREPAQLDVCYEDESLLVVDKPAGMPTVPDRAGKYRGVHGLLSALRPDADLRIAHRLDAGTSGLLILAKGLQPARELDAAFRAGEVDKEYVALVQGVVRRARFAVARALGPDRRRPGLVRVVDPASKGARAAHTDFATEELFRQHSLVRAWPRTGRSHQIRVHLASLGHAIVGDPDYGPERPLLLSDLKPGYKQRKGVEERPLLARMFLHAARIEVWSPARQQRIEVVAPLPAALVTVLGKLRHFAPAERRP